MKNSRVFSRTLTNAIRDGKIKVKTEYAQYLGRVSALEAKYRDRVESGLLPAKVRGSILNELEALEREISDIHSKRANELLSRAEKRKEEIAFERRNNPSTIMLRLEEAKLNISAMSSAERIALAMQYTADTIGLSREMALTLATVIPEDVAAGKSLRVKIRDKNLTDPVMGDGQVQSLEAAAASIASLGPSIECERINPSTGEPESFYIPIGQLVDLESE
jgi:hypothetical protein